jgi:hypothetical protein
MSPRQRRSEKAQAGGKAMPGRDGKSLSVPRPAKQGACLPAAESARPRSGRLASDGAMELQGRGRKKQRERAVSFLMEWVWAAARASPPACGRLEKRETRRKVRVVRPNNDTRAGRPFPFLPACAPRSPSIPPARASKDGRPGGGESWQLRRRSKCVRAPLRISSAFWSVWERDDRSPDGGGGPPLPRVSGRGRIGREKPGGGTRRRSALWCVWFAFLGQPGSRGAGKWRLVACTAPRARLSRCNFPSLACISRNARNGRFCRAKLSSCSCFSH